MKSTEVINVNNLSGINVSVVIPTYNRVNYIARAIKSVINQSNVVGEIIVVDNNSSDKTIEYINKSFPMVKTYKQVLKGVSNARNLGISKAKGNWIAFLDSDDEWCKNKIKEQVNFINLNKESNLVHTNEIWYRNGLKINQKKKHKKKGGHIFEDCLDICKISPSTVLFKKSLFQKYGLFNPRFAVCEDYELWLRICCKEKVGFIEKKLVIKYGGHSGQLSKKYWGIDRYRLLALENLVKEQKLTKFQKKIVINKILQKIDIIIKGAENRKNKRILRKYNFKKRKWKNKYAFL